MSRKTLCALVLALVSFATVAALAAEVEVAQNGELRAADAQKWKEWKRQIIRIIKKISWY